jgi:chemotaxis protein methyltransferase CheR
MVLQDHEFKRIRDLVYRELGIHLAEQKQALVFGRLSNLVNRRGLQSFEAYCEMVENDKTGKALSELANAISTNHTFFNREHSHFSFFENRALPEMTHRLRTGQSRDLRVWCAASSTGQEPYTLAMLMRRFFSKEITPWDAGLLATDISEKALESARLGIYDTKDVASLPEPLRKEYFKELPNQKVAVSPQLKRDVTFRRFNLINAVYPFKKPFHIVFCRNVLIYFDAPTKEKVFANMADNMVTGGYLFLGHTESMGRNNPAFEFVEPAVYRKV